MHIETIIGIGTLIITLIAIYISNKITLKTDKGISNVMKRSIILLTIFGIGITIYIISQYWYLGISSETILILTIFIYMIGISINRLILDNVLHRVLGGGAKKIFKVSNLNDSWKSI